MKTITKTTLFILSLIFILIGCSSKESVVIMDIHDDIQNMEYVQNPNEELGLMPDPEVDNRIEEAEKLSTKTEAEIDPNFVVEDPSWTTELVLDPEAVTADKIVEKPPVITYKYKFDKKFYDKPQWRSANQ